MALIYVTLPLLYSKINNDIQKTLDKKEHSKGLKFSSKSINEF